MLEKEIEARLAAYQDPSLGDHLLVSNAVKRITVSPDQITVEMVLGYPHNRIKNELIASLTAFLTPVAADKTLHIALSTRIDAHVGKQGIQALPQVKNIIAVGSGKGGVGKSMVAINLALALAQEGAAVGLLDADIYGPSQPAMLGTQDEKPVIKDRTIQPLRRHGIQSISIGNLVAAKTAMVWRGPMLGKALEQLMHDTAWDALDYLIVDLPPGTGDVQLTLCQKMPVSGAVVVTTPQDMALHDVRRACDMFGKLNVPILGVVENMSGYHCPHCGHDEPLFGEGGADTLIKEYGFSLLGTIPLDKRLRELTDSGHSPVADDPNSHYANMFCKIARQTAAKLTLQPKDFSAKFPKIVIQQDK